MKKLLPASSMNDTSTWTRNASTNRTGILICAVLKLFTLPPRNRPTATPNNRASINTSTLPFFRPRLSAFKLISWCLPHFVLTHMTWNKGECFVRIPLYQLLSKKKTTPAGKPAGIEYSLDIFSYCWLYVFNPRWARWGHSFHHAVCR